MNVSSYEQRGEILPAAPHRGTGGLVDLSRRPSLPPRGRDEVLAPGVPPRISARNLNFYYGSHRALIDNNLDIAARRVTAIIGPSGCGKSTHLRVYNRIFEMYRDHPVSDERA